MKLLQELSVDRKRVLVRCDFNVPLKDNGDIADDFRVQQALPTIRFLLAREAKIVLLSHLGDPEDTDTRFSMDAAGKRLAELLGVLVQRAHDCVGNEVKKKTADLKAGEILLLENVRFHAGEAANDQEFAAELAALGEVFVHDAFSVCHREHASVVGVPRLIPSGAGLLLQKEVSVLERVTKNVARPLVVIVGGAKIESKLPFLERMSGFADTLLVGNLLAREALEKKIVFSRPERVVFPKDGAPDNENALDIGGKTIADFTRRIQGAKTVVWAGPLGKYELAAYASGSLEIARAIIKSKCYSIAGGGNLGDFLGRGGFRESFSHVSTGGGAMLAFLSGAVLPGLQALNYYGDKKS
ncbi:MAG: phosphoglycerate kinase [Candidatus Wildermuthbacteria bacterium]|nr:phosphoglycerate kinase [Candidatus Wildermuthbacteria bacterium]